MKSISIINKENEAASCFFRSFVNQPYRKALVQITERCNLGCIHCFLSAGNYGDNMPLEVIKNILIPRLKQCSVPRLTLTGGEPFVHPDIIKIIGLFREADISVGICTNATNISTSKMDALAKIGGVHINVSLDGFSQESHGKFRGNKESFAKTIKTATRLAKHRLLQGLLVTPNNLARVSEYVEICDFADKIGATYVLMNPLSLMGRGEKSKAQYSSSEKKLKKIFELISQGNRNIQLVFARFPNDQLPLSTCNAGRIIYIFTHGEVTVCPYLIFASKNSNSKHRPEEFIVGNILEDENFVYKLNSYKLHEKYQIGSNSICMKCIHSSQCGRGCPAAIIASGQRIEGIDLEICPIKDFIYKDDVF